MKKVMLVFGTRPEAIKMCPIVRKLQECNDIETIVAVTGQHREMLEGVLQAFNIKPDYNLSIMKENQTLFDITEAVLEGMRTIMASIRPDVVVVHGDTSTSFAASLAAFYMGIKVAHVEAGLRTYDITAPYPEEFNRRAVGIISSFDFAPTMKAKDNLLKEGKNESNIWVTGNTVIDALKTTVTENYTHPELEWCDGRRMILITVHRRESIGEPMRRIFRTIKKVIDEHEDVCAIYPVHMNPEVRKVCREILDDDKRIHLIEPLDVVDFHNFINKSYLVLTDSGGIQEEAPSLGKPVLVLRDTTERPEGIEAGTAKLVGTEEQKIYAAFSQLLDDRDEYGKMAHSVNPYGDGNSSERIVKVLLDNLLEDKSNCI